MIRLPTPDRLVLFVLPLLTGLFFWLASLHVGYTPDETYVNLRYARNVARGDGFGFNAGVVDQGVSSPLWILLLAGANSTGTDPIIASKAFDLVFASIAVIMFYLLSLEVLRDRIVALLAMAVFALNAMWLRSAGTGTDTSLAVLVVIVAWWFCLRNEYLLAVVVLGFSFFVRSETVLLLPAVCADAVLNFKSASRGKRLAVKLFFVYALMLVVSLVAFRVAFGSFWTTPFLWVGGTVSGDAFSADIALLTRMNWPILLALIVAVPLFIMGIRNLDAEIRKGKTFFMVRQLAFGVVWIATVVASGILAPHVASFSKATLIIPPLVMILLTSLHHADVTVGRMRMYMVALLLIVVQTQYTYASEVIPAAGQMRSFRESSTVRMGKWIRDNSQPEAVLSSEEIGAVGYYSDRTVAPLPKARRIDMFAGDNEAVKRSVELFGTSFLVMTSLTPDPGDFGIALPPTMVSKGVDESTYPLRPRGYFLYQLH